jgi:hypothetical protein
MNTLIEKSIRKIEQTNYQFKRFIFNKINWNNRLISITGARGVGKTTLVLQYLKNLPLKDNERLYLSLDDIYFSGNKLVDVISDFVKYGGMVVAIDEVHKYPNWSREIKNLYDDFAELKIVFTGSSILEINRGDSDLSRRAVNYQLPTLSLREFTALESKIELKSYSLDSIIENHSQISKEINAQIKPLLTYSQYVKYGGFPYFGELGIDYHNQLLKTINIVLESDLTSVLSVDYSHILKLKRLLLLISESVPFKPNISELSSKVGITRETVLRYFDYLEKASLIVQLTANNKGFRRFEKPDKVYLNNSNYLFALSNLTPSIGTVRETFFLQHLSVISKVNYPNSGDFLINGKYLFEVGGKNKNYNQIKDTENSFLAVDDIEYGVNNKIPLWLFGFTY